MKKLFIGLIITPFILYFSASWIQYTDKLTLQNVIDNKINSLLPQPTFEYSNKINELNQINITIAPEDWKSLKSNYLGYLNNQNSKKYRQNNKWKNGEIEIDGKKYKGKIKCHGKTPYNHYDYKMGIMSLSIKSKEFPFSNKRFNLIIYNRINRQGEQLEYLSKEFNIYNQNSILYKARINDSKKTLMFLENRITPQYLDEIGFKNAKIEKPIEGKTTVLNNIRSEFLNDSTYQQLLNTDFSSSLETKKINTPIFKRNNTHFVNQFANKDQFIRFEAYRKLLGLTGHGLSNGNLLIYPDSVTKKLSFITHRDLNPAPYFKDEFFEKQIINWDNFANHDFYSYRNLLFELLLVNDSIRLGSYKYLSKKSNEIDNWIYELNEINTNHNEFFESNYLNQLFPIHNELVHNRYHPLIPFSPFLIKENWSKIKKDLSAASPCLEYSSTNSSCFILFSPNSIAELKLGETDFFIKNDEQYNIVVQSKEKHKQKWTQISNKNIQGIESLQSSIENLTFYDKVSHLGNRIKMIYRITITSTNKSVIINRFNCKIINETLNEEVPFQQVSIKIVR